MNGSDSILKNIKQKKDFLNYILHRYEFSDRIAVWIINFIKSHPTIIKNAKFIDTEGLKKSLRISTKDTGRPSLILNKGTHVMSDGETIFHELRFNIEEPFLLSFNMSETDAKYADLLESERNASAVASRDSLLERIDQALDNQNEDAFNALVEELKLLEEKSR